MDYSPWNFLFKSSPGISYNWSAKYNIPNTFIYLLTWHRIYENDWVPCAVMKALTWCSTHKTVFVSSAICDQHTKILYLFMILMIRRSIIPKLKIRLCGMMEIYNNNIYHTSNIIHMKYNVFVIDLRQHKMGLRNLVVM